MTVVHHLLEHNSGAVVSSNFCILSHLLLSLPPWYVQSCSTKPAFGHMEGLAFFTKEKALVNEISSEFIRKPIIIAAALETPAWQWTRTLLCNRPHLCNINRFMHMAGRRQQGACQCFPRNRLHGRWLSLLKLWFGGGWVIP